MRDDLPPYAGDELDEFLSAEIDGELDAAARDLGVDVNDVRARLRATTGADDRRAALVQARALLADPPEIDELLAARLRAKAVRAAADEHSARTLERQRRRRQMVLGAGGIAAATVAVVALAGGLNSQSGGTPAASGKPTTVADAPAAGGDGSTVKLPTPEGTPSLGSFTDKRSLANAAIASTATRRSTATLLPDKRALASGALSAPTAATPASAAEADQPGDRSSNQFASNGSASKSAADAGTGAAFGAQCPTPRPVRAGETLVLRTTATLSAKPVVVFVFAGNGEHAVEIEDAHCVLVDIQMLR